MKKPKEFELTDEARFKSPSLEEMYWSDPNCTKGEISICSYAGGEKKETHLRQGT